MLQPLYTITTWGLPQECQGSSTYKNSINERACFSSTYTGIGMMQKGLVQPLCKEETKIHEIFHI